MREALPVFILASFIVFIFQRVGGLQALEELFKPVTTGLMGLPEKSVQVFIKTMIRRESGATELEHLRGIYTNLQLVINLLVMTFLTPCLNAIIVLIKERGPKTAGILIFSVLSYAVIFGTVLNAICKTFGITFT
jgi:ferrous iron transport protein B